MDGHAVDGTDVEPAHLDTLSHEIGLQVVPLPKFEQRGKPVGNADAEPREGIQAGNALEHHPVDIVVLLDYSCPVDDGGHFLHPLYSRNFVDAGRSGRHRGLFPDIVHVRRRELDVSADGSNAAAYLPAETGRHGDGDYHYEEGDCDGNHRNLPLETEFPCYESRGFHYQMCTRSDSGRNIGSPSLMPKASKK